MQNIPLSLARAGMILAREVVHPQRPDGPVLFGRGVALSAAALDRLGKIGVVSLTVEGRPVQFEGEETLAQHLDKLEQRFRLVGEDAFMMHIKRHMATHIRRTLGE